LIPKSKKWIKKFLPKKFKLKLKNSLELNSSQDNSRVKKTFSDKNRISGAKKLFVSTIQLEETNFVVSIENFKGMDDLFYIDDKTEKYYPIAFSKTSEGFSFSISELKACNYGKHRIRLR
jgi:hypothetical protein